MAAIVAGAPLGALLLWATPTGALGVGGPPPYEPPPFCTYDEDTKTVLVSGELQALIDIFVQGGAIFFQRSDDPPKQCGSATTTNTDTIRLEGATGAPGPGLHMSGGPFAPGFTPESEGISEIELHFEPSGRAQLTVLGSDAAEVFRIGTNGVDLNEDGDVDLTLGVLTGSLNVVTGDGDDVITARGGGATGGPTNISLAAGGGRGDNRIVGGRGRDLISGGRHRDLIKGMEGNDFLTGSQGSDRLVGGPGRDTISGVNADDVLSGGPSRDELDGGSGEDRCRDGPGKDKVTRCEG